jgi:serine protease Do
MTARLRGISCGLLAALLPVLLAAQPRSGEATFERVKESLFTIQLHSGAQDARDVLGSGYVISADGLLATNYHVVAAYVDEPKRYRILARNRTGEFPATLVRFDVINDLAVLRIEAPRLVPLRLAAAPAVPGSPVTAFGNPHGLGLSLIEGVFNGFAEKGTVDRMMLSMPLNSGMSGGPILNAREEVIGTNVSVIWLANSLSFGVPVAKLQPLLSAPPLAADRDVLRAEVRRQLGVLGQDAFERVIRPFVEGGAGAVVKVGRGEVRQPPPVFDCWNSTDVHKDAGVTSTRYSCNLQFTPSVESVGVVGSIELQVDHMRSERSTFGFYGTLADYAAKNHEAEAHSPENGVFSPPRCQAARLRTDTLRWNVNTCLSAYVLYPGFQEFDLSAISVSHPRDVLYIGLHMKGFDFAAFEAMSGALLRHARMGEAR